MKCNRERIHGRIPDRTDDRCDHAMKPADQQGGKRTDGA